MLRNECFVKLKGKKGKKRKKHVSKNCQNINMFECAMKLMVISFKNNCKYRPLPILSCHQHICLYHLSILATDDRVESPYCIRLDRTRNSLAHVCDYLMIEKWRMSPNEVTKKKTKIDFKNGIYPMDCLLAYGTFSRSSSSLHSSNSTV